MLLEMTQTPFAAGSTAQLFGEAAARVQAQRGGAPTMTPLDTAEVDPDGGVDFGGLDAETPFWLAGQDYSGAWRWVKVGTAPSNTAYFESLDPEDVPTIIDIPADQTADSFLVRKGGVELFSIDADGVLHLQGINTTATGPLMLRDRWPINARDHGFDPDAMALENTIALTAALDQAELLGHDVFIPAGRYEVDYGATTFTVPGLGDIVRAFNLRSHVKIFGEEGTVIYGPDPTADITVFGGPQHVVFGNNGTAHHWAVEDIEFDGGFDAYIPDMVEQVHSPIYVGPCKNFSIRGNEMYGWRGGVIHGIQYWDGADVADWTERFTVSENHIHDCLGVGIDFDRGAREFWCQDNVVEYELGPNDDITVFGSESIWFGNGAFEKLKAVDGVITGNRVRRYGAFALENVERCKIRENSVIQPDSNPCYRMAEMSYCDFSGNYGDADSPEPTADGRVISFSFSYRFHDNTIRGNTCRRQGLAGSSAAIRLTGIIQGERIVLCDNVVDDNGAFALGGSEGSIHVDHVTRLTLRGNTCDEHIDIDGSVTDATIDGNTCSFMIVNCNESTIGPNNCKTTDGPAMWLGGAENAVHLGRLEGVPAFGVGVLRVDGSYNNVTGGIVKDSRVIVNQAMVSEHGGAGNNTYRGVKLIGPQSAAANAKVLAGTSDWA